LHLTGVDALPELSTAQTSGSPLVNTTATFCGGKLVPVQTWLPARADFGSATVPHYFGTITSTVLLDVLPAASVHSTVIV
jgi:hypothetical protein